MMFAAANFLAYSCQIRMVWFRDINHIESNAEKAVFVAAGLPQINEKVSFLARLPYGPRKDAGHWHSQMRQAFEAPTIIQQETSLFFPVSLFRMLSRHHHTCQMKSPISSGPPWLRIPTSELFGGSITNLFCPGGSPGRAAIRQC